MPDTYLTHRTISGGWLAALSDLPSPPWGRGWTATALSPAVEGRVRGWWACTLPFAVHVAPLKALGNDHPTFSTFSRNPRTALRCLWFQGIDPLTPPSPSPPRGRGENVESRVGAHRAPLQMANPLLSHLLRTRALILYPSLRTPIPLPQHD